MGKYTYFILNLIFFVPPLYLIVTKYSHHLKRYSKLLIVTSVFAGVFYFIADPLAAYWGAWNYHFEKTLGIRIGDSVFETFLWSIFIAIIFGLLVGVLADREDKKHKRK